MFRNVANVWNDLSPVLSMFCRSVAGAVHHFYSGVSTCLTYNGRAFATTVGKPHCGVEHLVRIIEGKLLLVKQRPKIA
jgi:hypothetical protein